MYIFIIYILKAFLLIYINSFNLVMHIFTIPNMFSLLNCTWKKYSCIISYACSPPQKNYNNPYMFFPQYPFCPFNNCLVLMMINSLKRSSFLCFFVSLSYFVGNFFFKWYNFFKMLCTPLDFKNIYKSKSCQNHKVLL